MAGPGLGTEEPFQIQVVFVLQTAEAAGSGWVSDLDLARFSTCADVMSKMIKFGRVLWEPS